MKQREFTEEFKREAVRILTTSEKGCRRNTKTRDTSAGAAFPGLFVSRVIVASGRNPAT